MVCMSVCIYNKFGFVSLLHINKKRKKILLCLRPIMVIRVIVINTINPSISVLHFYLAKTVIVYVYNV